MRVSRLQLVMAFAAVALIIDSFLPWYGVRWSTTRLATGHVTTHVNTASAWDASTAWSAGIALTLVATAGSLLWPGQTFRRGRVPAATLVVAFASAVTIAWTCLLALWSESQSGGASIVPASSTADGLRPGEIVRDSVTSGTVMWGCYLGVLLMLTIAACGFVLGQRDERGFAASGITD